MGKNIPTIMADHLLKLVLCLVVVMNTHQVHGHVLETRSINITYVTDASKIGAVCNDGSAAAYYHVPGYGEGANNWFIILNGGGWCGSERFCTPRLNDWTGSSLHNNQTNRYEPIPDFNNWNRVNVVYCDSSSFMGEADHPNITTRGARIFDAVMEELLQKGLASSTEVLFGGGSAGGLAALLHCDGFRALLPQSSRVKCVIDSGFFIHAPTLHGAEKRANMFASIVAYHGFANKLPQSCTSRMNNASLCIFPEYIIKDVQTPLFLVESKFDQYQLKAHSIRNDYNAFEKCTADLSLCTPSMLQSMKDYGVAITGLLKEIRETTSIGMFVQPCILHGHFSGPSGWFESYSLRNKTIAQAIGDWFFDRDNSFQEIDFDHELPLNCTKPSNM